MGESRPRHFPMGFRSDPTLGFQVVAETIEQQEVRNSIGLCVSVIAGRTPAVSTRRRSAGCAASRPMYIDIDSMHFGSNRQLQRAEVFLLAWIKANGWTPALNPSRLFVRSFRVWRFEQIHSHLEDAVCKVCKSVPSESIGLRVA